MPNDYFQFKQFVVHQKKAAMKVCTDACLFGAWVGNMASANNFTGAAKALDIGTGTGLLSLMLAQQFPGTIDAIDIDKGAAIQAAENIAASNWNNRIIAHQSSLEEWKNDQYNLIISNPPFYEQDLKSPDLQRNLALHDSGLTLGTLWENIKRCLLPDGIFAVLLPYHRLTECLQFAGNYGFYLHEKVVVHQTEKHPAFRVMLLFKRENNVSVQKCILIKKEGAYSIEFIALLKDYYLHL